jgi:hypothetical protein
MKRNENERKKNVTGENKMIQQILDGGNFGVVSLKFSRLVIKLSPSVKQVRDGFSSKTQITSDTSSVSLRVAASGLPCT